MINAVRIFFNYSFIIVAALVLLASCKKQESLVGKNLIPGTDYINGIFTDTLTVSTKTVREDSLISENMSKFVVGSMNDNVFGKSYAGIYTQLVLNNAGISFNDTAFIDSVVLSLNLSGFYGDSTSAHTLRVFRLTDSIKLLTNDSYKTYSTFGFDPTPIGTKSGYKINKGVLNTIYKDVDGKEFGPSLRIALDTLLGHDILAQKPDGALKDNPNFQRFFKGIYIDEDTSSGFSNNMIYVNLRGDNSFMGVYYHTPKTSGKVVRFFTRSPAINTNYYKHNYGGKIIETAIANATPSIDSAVYIQSMAGTKTWITIPHLSSLGRVLINKAEIEITMAPSNISDSAIYTPPARMELAVADSLFRNYQTVDETFPTGEGLPAFGGTKFYMTDSAGHKLLKYRFSIAGELQKMADGNYINNGFYLLTFPSNQIAERIIIGGGNRNKDAYQLKLNLVYTKLP